MILLLRWLTAPIVDLWYAAQDSQSLIAACQLRAVSLEVMPNQRPAAHECPDERGCNAAARLYLPS